MNMKRSLWVALALLMAAANAVAKSETKGDVELGLVSTNGNTKTQTINAKARATTTYENWKHSLTLEGLNSSNREATTAERYIGQVKSNYAISERGYVFGQVLGTWDRFSGYDYRASEVVGYGHKFIKEEDLTLDGELGVGMRQSKPDRQEVENKAIGFLGANLGWKISPTSQFGEELTVEAGSDAVISKSVTSLTSKVAGNLATKLSYTYRHVSDVPTGIRKGDSIASVTLVYSF